MIPPCQESQSCTGSGHCWSEDAFVLNVRLGLLLQTQCWGVAQTLELLLVLGSLGKVEKKDLIFAKRCLPYCSTFQYHNYQQHGYLLLLLQTLSPRLVALLEVV